MNSPQERKAFWKKIRVAREKQGLTQQAVAKKAGMSVNYYACVERGEQNASLEKIQGVAKALGLKLDVTS